MRLLAQHPSRRAFIKLGLLSGAATLLPLRAHGSVDPAQLITKQIPGSSQFIPVAGIGTNQFGRSRTRMCARCSGACTSWAGP